MKWEKVQEGKTRFIECCPFDVLLVMRRILGTVAAFFTNNPSFSLWSAIGIDPDRDWDSLYKTMKHFGDFAIDLDFQNFDGSVSTFMVVRALEVLMKLNGLDGNCISSVCSTFARYEVFYLDNVDVIQGGVPSGMPFTSLINTVINITNTVFCLSKVFHCNPYQWRERVRVLCYGDDIMMVLARDVQVDCEELTNSYRELGMVATSSKKDAVKVCMVHELQFLKREFVRIGERVYPSIDEKSIFSLLAWKSKRNSGGR